MPPKAAGVDAGALATQLTDEVLRELVLDIAIEEHRLAQFRRSRAARAPASVQAGASNGLLAAPNGAAIGEGASPSPSPTKEGLLECPVCSRSIAASRFAAHLAQCMGLSGSRRGAGRAASTANGKNGAGSAAGSRAGSAAGSDTDSGSKSNGIKRSASASPAANGAPKQKKAKPTPVQTGVPPQFQPPHVGSHPLAKTMSLPSSPLTGSPASSPSVVGGRAVPPPPPPLSATTPSSARMQARASLPGSAPPSATLPNPALTATKRPPHPLAQSPARPPLSNTQMASDRPDSDSESDSDLDAKPAPPPRNTGSAGSGQKVPRGGLGQTQTTAPQERPGVPGGAGAPQKMPRKGKNGRPIAKGVVDSDSEDDDVASDGSDSD
ncbi:hypothetical protein JCM8547_005305 [Rhodosporidiobolus lusitaniae]